MKKELGFGLAAKGVLRLLQLQRRFAKLAENRVDGWTQVADDRRRQSSGTMSGNADIKDDGPWCGALGQGQDEAAARAGWDQLASRAPASDLVMMV